MFIIRTIFVKPENAFNVPEKYIKIASQTRKFPVKKTEETTEETTEERQEESYDIDPRQPALEDTDLSKVK